MLERSILQQERILSQEKQLTICPPKDETLPLSSFFLTTPYTNFVEFCDQCRRFRYVGISYGLPGVGKTIAARLYAQWDKVEPLLTRKGIRTPLTEEGNFLPRVALYTPGRTIKPRQIESDVTMLFWSLQHLDRIALRCRETEADVEEPVPDQLELLIIDNVHRLEPVCMDVLQDLYDRYQIGVVLLGSEVLIHKHLARLHHLRVRVGDVRPFQPLSRKEVLEMMSHMLHQLNIDFQSSSGLSLEQLMEEIYAVTQGNLSLLRHFLTQIVILLQGKQTNVVTSLIVQQAYVRLRLE
jgi:DNA transposition AAA+ family ATPase